VQGTAQQDHRIARCAARKSQRAAQQKNRRTARASQISPVCRRTLPTQQKSSANKYATPAQTTREKRPNAPTRASFCEVASNHAVIRRCKAKAQRPNSTA